MSSIEVLKKEVERYKSLYEHEREQFDEFQRYSKEVETELETELSFSTKKINELESQNSRLLTELETHKSRYEQERNEYLNNENQLKVRIQASDELCRDLRQKLRVVEQANDDLERRDRIRTQELIDLSSRYDHCLERCAFLESGLITSSVRQDSDGRLNMSNPKNSLLFLRRLSGGSSLVENEFREQLTPGPPLSDICTNTSGIGTSVIDDSLLSSSSHSHLREINNEMNKQMANELYGYISVMNENFNGKIQSPNAFTGNGSTQLVSQLIRKIEEVEKHVDPKKYNIQRSTLPRAN